MNKQDQMIKKELRKKLVPINDSGFTERIVTSHKLKMEKKKYSPLDFISIILGILGSLVALMISFTNLRSGLGLSENQLIVIQIIPIVYLFYQLLNEIFINENSFLLRSSTIIKSLTIGLLLLALSSIVNG